MQTRSLSRRIGSTEGTRPQPMSTDQNYVAVSNFNSKRHWSTKLDLTQSVDKLVGTCQLPNLVNSLLKPHNCAFVPAITARDIVVNRVSNVVLTLGKNRSAGFCR
jgi:hypothetical protein